MVTRNGETRSEIYHLWFNWLLDDSYGACLRFWITLDLTTWLLLSFPLRFVGSNFPVDNNGLAACELNTGDDRTLSITWFFVEVATSTVVPIANEETVYDWPNKVAEKKQMDQIVIWNVTHKSPLIKFICKAKRFEIKSICRNITPVCNTALSHNWTQCTIFARHVQDIIIYSRTLKAAPMFLTANLRHWIRIVTESKISSANRMC